MSVKLGRFQRSSRSRRARWKQLYSMKTHFVFARRHHTHHTAKVNHGCIHDVETIRQWCLSVSLGFICILFMWFQPPPEACVAQGEFCTKWIVSLMFDLMLFNCKCPLNRFKIIQCYEPVLQQSKQRSCKTVEYFLW